MKTFRDFLFEMDSTIPANAAGEIATVDQRVAGIGTDPPVNVKVKKKLNKNIMKRKLSS